MPDNQGLSHLSDHFLIVAVVLYSLAVIAFAADFAFGRRSPVVSRAGAGVRHRVPAAVGAGAGAWTVTRRTALRWTALRWTALRWAALPWTAARRPVVPWPVVPEP